MKEPEELKVRDSWLAKRDAAALRVRADVDKYFSDMEKCADRLEIRGGMHFNPSEHGAPLFVSLRFMC